MMSELWVVSRGTTDTQGRGTRHPAKSKSVSTHSSAVPKTQSWDMGGRIVWERGGIGGSCGRSR